MGYKTNDIAVIIGSLSIGFSACTPGFEGEYSDPATQEIVDDKWNETDARVTAEHMVKEMLGKPWLASYQKKNGRKPTVIVDEVENRTDEHLDTKALTEYIRDELINSGRVRFLNKAQRDKLLNELKWQNSGDVSKSTAKKRGRAIGADYMLRGAISSNVHTQEELKTVTYQTALTLTNIESFEFEWSSKKQIKKRFRRSGVGW